jgi:hypothetical protein
LRKSAHDFIMTGMNTITAVLEPDVDGTVHLPLPLGFRNCRVRVTATLDRVEKQKEPVSREDVLVALTRLRERGTFRNISDPVAWQRQIRRDRPQPGREE